MITQQESILKNENGKSEMALLFFIYLKLYLLIMVLNFSLKVQLIIEFFD